MKYNKKFFLLLEPRNKTQFVHFERGFDCIGFIEYASHPPRSYTY
jgi:hypothetical protein